MLYRSTDRLCRSGAPMENLFESDEKNAPSKSGTKHLDHPQFEGFEVRQTVGRGKAEVA